MTKRLSFIFSLLLLFQLVTSGFALPMQVIAEKEKSIIKEGVIEDTEAEETRITFKWSIQDRQVKANDRVQTEVSKEYDIINTAELIDENNVASVSTEGSTVILTFTNNVDEHPEASGEINVDVKKKETQDPIDENTSEDTETQDPIDENTSEDTEIQESSDENASEDTETQDPINENTSEDTEAQDPIDKNASEDIATKELSDKDKTEVKKSNSNKKINYSVDQLSGDSAKKPVDNITLTPNKEPMSKGGLGKIEIEWSIDDGSYGPGDLIKIQLPEDLSPPSKSLGDEFLQCSVVGKELFCTFTDAVEGETNVSGELWYETMYLPSETSDSEEPQESEKDFEFSSGGDIFSNPTKVVLPTDGSGTPGQHKTHQDIEKWATDVTWEYGEDGSKVLKWQVELNGNLTENLGETIYTDKLGVGHEVIEDSIDVSVLHSNDGPTGTHIVSAPYEGPEPTIEVAEDNKSFKVTFADNTLSGYRANILYKTKITNENVGKWVNGGNVDNDKYNSGKTNEYLNTDFGAQDRADNPDPSTVKFLKVEEDENGPGVAGVEFNVYNAGGEFIAKTLYPTDNNGNAGVWTEENGYKLEPGVYYATEISGEANADYEVDENKRYYFVITENEGTVLTVINEKKDNVKTSVKIDKQWENDTKDDRPESVKIQLYQNGEAYKDTKTLTESSKWTYTFNNLPKYDEDGEPYEYSVKEIDVPEGYTSKVDGTTIINTYESSKIDVFGEKVWEDKDQSTRPDSIIINLLQNGKKIDNKIVTPDEDDNWTYEFKDLSEFDDEGEAIEYTVEEEPVKGYNSEVSGDTKEGFTVTNTQKTYAVGDYVWIDDNKDGLQDENEKPLEGVTVELYDSEGNLVDTTTTNEKGLYIFDNLPAGDYHVEFTLTEEQEKIYEFTKQNAGDDSANDSDANDKGVTKQFTLDDNNKALTKEYEDQNFEATEGIDPTWDAGVIKKEPLTPIEPGKTKVSVEKVWKGEAQDKATIILLADGKEIDSVDLSEDNDWNYTFTDLPVVNDITDEETIEYTIEEVEVEGYNSEITGNAEEGFVVINTRTGETQVSGEKIWEDNNDEAKLRPESITVTLLQNGEKINSIVVTEKDNWKFSFKKLDKYDEEGQEYDYSVVEEEVENYTASYDENSYDITNTIHKIDNEEEESDDKNEEETPNKSEDKKDVSDNQSKTDDGETLPKTATNFYNILLAGSMILVMGGVLLLIARRHKVNN